MYRHAKFRIKIIKAVSENTANNITAGLLHVSAGAHRHSGYRLIHVYIKRCYFCAANYTCHQSKSRYRPTSVRLISRDIAITWAGDVTGRHHWRHSLLTPQDRMNWKAARPIWGHRKCMGRPDTIEMSWFEYINGIRFGQIILNLASQTKR